MGIKEVSVNKCEFIYESNYKIELNSKTISYMTITPTFERGVVSE